VRVRWKGGVLFNRNTIGNKIKFKKNKSF